MPFLLNTSYQQISRHVLPYNSGSTAPLLATERIPGNYSGVMFRIYSIAEQDSLNSIFNVNLNGGLRRFGKLAQALLGFGEHGVK